MPAWKSLTAAAVGATGGDDKALLADILAQVKQVYQQVLAEEKQVEEVIKGTPARPLPAPIDAAAERPRQSATS